MFTSCCPGWVRFLKSNYPHLTGQLSSAKSPMQMFGAVMKTHFTKEIGVAPENIYSVAIMPCVAKKGERNMEFFHEEYAGHDTDCVLTSRELIRMIKAFHILPETLEDAEPGARPSFPRCYRCRYNFRCYRRCYGGCSQNCLSLSYGRKLSS